jgi:hypothetical protein
VRTGGLCNTEIMLAEFPGITVLLPPYVCYRYLVTPLGPGPLPIGPAQSPYQAGRDGYPLTTYIAQNYTFSYTFSCIDLEIYVL